ASHFTFFEGMRKLGEDQGYCEAVDFRPTLAPDSEQDIRETTGGTSAKSPFAGLDQWLSEAVRGVDGKMARITGAETHPKAR
ncbi:MAG: hypothetical protein WCK27_08005, partial [Verrucomicrobiota bacterium]